MATCFLGVDAGSASVRAAVFDARGHRLGFAAHPIRQFRPQPLHVEQSSADIWNAVTVAVREAVAAARVAPASVAAIGFDATCSLVAVAEGGKPLSVAVDGAPERDVVMWMDHRAGAEAAAINATRDPALAYVGGEVSVEMELPKILWLRRQFPQRYASAWRLLDLADWLVWRCTGADAASVCTLACKWNYLAHEARFPHAMLAKAGLADLVDRVPRRILPLGTAAGTLSSEAAAALGLTGQVVVATGIIDAHAGGLALVGAAPLGALALIAGTSTCHMAVSERPLMVPGVWGPYFGAMLPGLWLSEGGQSAAGALLDWTVAESAAGPIAHAAAERERRGVHEVLNDWVAALSAREPMPTRHLHVLADHHGNRSPRADPNAAGAITGLTLESGEAALARRYLATIQSLAYGTRQIVEAMEAAGHRIRRVVACGGLTHNPLYLQEHADVLGRDVELVADDDAVALGAALLGAVAAGAFPDLPEAARAMVRPGRRVVARHATRAFHDAKYEVFQGMYDEGRRARERMARVEAAAGRPLQAGGDVLHA